MNWYQSLYEQMRETRLAGWLDDLPQAAAEALRPERHGRISEWLDTLDKLPQAAPSRIDLQNGVIVGLPEDIPPETRHRLETQLRRLQPWRKGPYDLFGLHIDTEWRSDWKWDRLKEGIRPLNGRLVLDVGCGNGYHAWRMTGAGAKLVIGLDPYLLYMMQYRAVRHFLPDPPVYVLPLGIEALPPKMRAFDTVFSLGVLYHRRSPFDHLLTLRDALRPGGELALETLVIDGRNGEILVPEGRYAQMRNVWFIPTPDTLVSWLRKCGFRDIRLLDVTPTTTAEQRSTDWMTYQSLSDFLDPVDASRTIEGYPAPERAVLTAVAP